MRWIRQHRPTDFERGLHDLGRLLIRFTVFFSVVIVGANLALHRPLIDSLLFSLALAVGLTPQLLPAIVSVTLSRGARAMADNGVIVKRLDAIENLGSMTVLCSDKTGTLTSGKVVVDRFVDSAGLPSAETATLAYLNSSMQGGYDNPIDAAIKSSSKRRRTGIPQDRRIAIRLRPQTPVGARRRTPRTTADHQRCSGVGHGHLHDC